VTIHTIKHVPRYITFVICTSDHAILNRANGSLHSFMSGAFDLVPDIHRT
jgi:hypothetical protein